jgi:hypothetical protein
LAVTPASFFSSFSFPFPHETLFLFYFLGLVARILFSLLIGRLGGLYTTRRQVWGGSTPTSMKRNFKATYIPPPGSPVRAPSSSPPAPCAGDGENVIKFYGARNANGCFSNFSAHPILLRGKQWPVHTSYLTS